MLRLEDVSKDYPGAEGPLRVLDRVSLAVKPGQAVAVIGPSGSGKSTLLGLAAGLDTPSSGRLFWGDTEIGGLSEAALARLRRRRVGIVFQAYHLIPALTALENVALPLELNGERDPEARALEELAAVGLAGRAGHLPAKLSGGEQQRVALARAFAARPELLLADEPTGNLDSATGAKVLDLILRLRAERRTTLVLVTHDPAVAALADRVVSLKDGRIVEDRLNGHHGAAAA